MSTEEGSKNQPSQKGFSGLSSMVSDIGATEVLAEQPNLEPKLKATPESNSRASSPESRQAPQPNRVVTQPSSDASSGWNVYLVICGFLIFIFLIAQWDKKQSRPTPTYNQNQASSEQSAPAQELILPAVPEKPVVPARPSEEMPPVGTELVFQSAQIRYCLAEDVRLDAAKEILDSYAQSEVDRFNSMVADYNSRCSRFRYRKGALEAARSEIEGVRSMLVEEGRGRFSRETVRGFRPLPAESPQPDTTVLALQQRLGELGYDVGNADGQGGLKTRAAISAFQRDYGLPVDGIVSSSILAHAKAVSPRQATPSTVEQVNPSRDLSRITAWERQSIQAVCSSQNSLYGPAAYNKCLTEKGQALEHQGSAPDLSRLTVSERQSIQSVCSTQNSLYGPAAYYKCLAEKNQALERQGSAPDLSRLTASERQSIQSVCSTQNSLYGPAAYYKCLTEKSQALERQGSAPDLSRFEAWERQSIQSVCSTQNSLYGPAAYNKCLIEKSEALVRRGSAPDLSRLTAWERQSIQSACSTQNSLYGPAEYYKCFAEKISVLELQGSAPDLSRLTTTARQSIEFSCSTQNTLYGPAAYYQCVRQQLNR